MARSGALGALAWTAFKVGALSFGGGFVIIPLMQGDAVHTYHWMTNAQFLNAVALGQITPGPVVATVAAVGYAAARGRRRAARRARRLQRPRSPSSSSAGGASTACGENPNAARLPRRRRPGRDRRDPRRRDHRSPAPCSASWQFGVLAAAAIALLLLRRGVVQTLLAAGAIGVIVALAGAPLP